MEKKIISAGEIRKFIANIIESGVETYGVQEKETGKFHYAVLQDADALRLDYNVTITPPKKFFMPEREIFLKYQIAPEVKVRPVFETNKRIIIGVHPYDMIAINQMDEIWMDKNEDQHYFKRRKNTIIIGVDPEIASSWSFWHVMDAWKVDAGYDIWLTRLDGETYFIEAATAAGRELVDKHAKTSNAAKEHEDRRAAVRAKLFDVCDKERKLSVRPGEIPLLVKNNWDHKVWEEKAKKCYSCGSCNIVCPTCYCFDVKDDINLNIKDGWRERVWDACQLEDFALVAHGENFRAKRVDRYKHRFYRKTVYQYERYNHLACVGCGRCSSVCLPNIADPVDIINTIKEGR